jgi:hypothetical protein
MPMGESVRLPDAVSVFVDARDGRLLVVDDPAAVVFDLETGHILGTARLPVTDPSSGWHRLSLTPDAASRLPVTGRTVVLSNSSSRTEQVLAFDMVTLTGDRLTATLPCG